MAVLREYKLLQKLVGLNPLGGRENIYFRVFHLFVLCSFDLLALIDFIRKTHGDIDQALAALPTIFGMTLLIANYLHLLVCRERINSLLDDLQNIVIESETQFIICLGYWNWFRLILIGGRKVVHGRIYIRAEQLSSITAKIIICGILSVQVFTFSPLVLAAYHWCLKKYSLESWFHLYPIW